MIFEKTTNKELLKAIIKSKNKSYKRKSKLLLKYYSSTKIPYQDVSNFDFAKERLKKLQ